MRQTIAAIGAGLSGRVATRELAEAGLDVTCFEKSQEIGGIFSNGEASKCYDSVVLATSNYFTACSDFMPYGEPLKFWRFQEYAAYLKRYAAHFGVDRRIRFGHGLQSMKRLPTRQLLSFTLLAFVAGLAIFGFFSFDPRARCRLRASAQLPE